MRHDRGKGIHVDDLSTSATKKKGNVKGNVKVPGTTATKKTCRTNLGNVNKVVPGGGVPNPRDI